MFRHTMPGGRSWLIEPRLNARVILAMPTVASSINIGSITSEDQLERHVNAEIMDHQK